MNTLPPIQALVRYYGENAVVLDHDPSGSQVLLRFDTDGLDGPREEWIDDPECAHVQERGQLEHFALVTPAGANAPCSPHGCVISRDGTVYTLLGRGLHGVVMAMLHPEIANKHGYRQPEMNPVTMHYTGFQMEAGGEVPLVRITFGFMTAVGVSKSHAPATLEQIEATRKVLLGAGLKPGTKISCSIRDLSVSQALDWLREDHTPEVYDPATYVMQAPDLDCLA